MNEKMYSEKELVDFGNYLLSAERSETIVHPRVKDKVNDVDLAIWSEKDNASNG